MLLYLSAKMARTKIVLVLNLPSKRLPKNAGRKSEGLPWKQKRLLVEDR